MMKESRVQDITSRIQSEETLIIFGYAPICANCQIAERMLDVVAELRNFSYASIDLNYQKDFIETYEIRSTPALLLFKNGELTKEIYAFQSVPYLTEVMDEFLVDE
ncbi:thioredoxin family protein [Salinicoccus cyprini]|uniref:Thioredoxin family protein n=1 Tax=Salinicoccus cyprini TaxID=2493691 RepID=A0A558AWU8_9STAP|nr:thioredoxin family protein [Salinicoccus cyprini]TVT28711.1 thioredoxin family protein [Salinicoccus cyprini]